MINQPVADYTVLDLETTGFNPTNDRIIEIGAVKYRNHQIVDEFHMLLNPTDVTYLSPKITEVTHITNKMMKGGHDYQDGLRRIVEFVGDDVIIGHNVNFDVNFLYDQTEMQLGHVFDNNYMDTMTLLRKLHPELAHHRLADLTELYAITNKGAHRALNDVYATQAGYIAICKEMDPSFVVPKIEPKVQTSVEKVVPKKDYVASSQKPVDSTHQTPAPKKPRIVKPTILDQLSKNLKGSNWAITGQFDAFTRLQLINFLEQHGGIVHPNVIASTHFLIQGTFVQGYLSTTPQTVALYPKLIVLFEADFLALMKG